MRKAMRLAVPILLLCGVAAAAGPYYLLTYTVTPGVKVTALTPEQQKVFMAHGQQIGQLQQSGLMYMAGHTTNPENVTGVGIVSVKDEAAARAIADGDPAVKAGLLKVTVEPFDLFFPPVAPALMKDSKTTYDLITRFVMEAARKMPEEQYGFRPTAEVRTFGQILAHIAETQYIGCGSVRGETYAPHDFEKTRTGKAEIIGTLEAAFAYCQEAWTKTTDAAAADRVPLFGQPRAKLMVLDTGTSHVFEHYGNLVTYMRLKGLVPPSTEGRATP